MPLSINGFGTNTKSAFQLAYDVCLGQYSANKRGPFNKVRTVVILITDGRWNWPFHDPSPIPIAQMLLAANVEVFAIGVRYSITRDTLQKVVKDPAKQAFILGDFLELEKLSLYLSGGGKGTKYFNHIQTWCLLRSRKSFKLNNFKIVKAMTFPKCCQVKFNLLVLTCPSTLTLPWQPSFDNHICLFYVKSSITNSPYSYPSLIFL